MGKKKMQLTCKKKAKDGQSLVHNAEKISIVIYKKVIDLIKR